MSENLLVASTDLHRLTTDILSSYLANKDVAAEEIPQLILSVYQALANAGHEKKASETLTPAVPIARSVFPDHIVCLEDGRKLKMLKRHLMSAYGMSTDEYRARWGLPYTYPMIAPSYAAERSQLARKIGLGRKTSSHNEEINGVQVTRFPESRRGRKKVIKTT